MAPKAQKVTFRNDSKLKKANVAMEYTPEQINELRLCHDSIYHFAEKYFEIITLDADNDGERRRIIKTRPYQKRVLDSVINERFTIVLSPRQIGKCVSPSTYINIRNKKTGEVEKISIENFYKKCSK